MNVLSTSKHASSPRSSKISPTKSLNCFLFDLLLLVVCVVIWIPLLDWSRKNQQKLNECLKSFKAYCFYCHYSQFIFCSFYYVIYFLLWSVLKGIMCFSSIFFIALYQIILHSTWIRMFQVILSSQFGVFISIIYFIFSIFK